MSKTVRDIEEEGGKCEKVATDFWECTDKDDKVWWCSDSGNACVEKPKVSMSIKGLEEEGAECKQMDKDLWICHHPDGKVWACRGREEDSSCIIIHNPDEKKPKRAIGFLEMASGSVRLSGEVAGNELKLYAQEHVFGNDRTIAVYAKYNGTQIIRSVFSHDNDNSITLIAQDDDARVKVVLQDSVDPEFGYVTVTHDYGVPKVFKINIDDFLKTKSFKCFDGEEIDVVGRRNPPKITSLEIFNTFKNNDSYRSFMRGDQPEIELSLLKNEKSVKNIAKGVNWKCAWICAIPACGLTCLLWKPLKDKEKNKLVHSNMFATV